MLDAAFAGEFQRAFGEKIELGDIERIVSQAEIRGELARRDRGQQQLADVKRDMNILLAQRRGEVLVSVGSILLLARDRQPGPPRHVLAEHLFEVETIAVEGDIDGRLVAAAIGEGAGEFGAAQLAARVLELEVAAAERGIRGKGESADAGLRRHVAIAGGPARQRAQLRAFELDRPCVDRTLVAARQETGGLDPGFAREVWR